jgi:hypothetical protein
MRHKAKASIIILVILLILSLSGAVTGFYSFQKERIKLIALNEELDDLKVKKRIVENKLEESTKIIGDLNVQLDSTRTKIEELNTELDKEKSEKNKLFSQIQNLETQLKEQEEVKKELETKQIQAQEKIKELQASLQRFQTSKEELKTQLDRYKTREEVTLGKIIVGEKKPVEVKEASVTELDSSKLEGRVLVLNKDYDFAVINLGSLNGLSSGELFSVYKEGIHIGDIQAERVQEAMSAFGFLSEEIKDTIQEGDNVTLNRIVAQKKQAIEETLPVVTQAPTETPEQVQVAPALRGKVLVVNKEYDFAVINLGSRDGIVVGDTFLVYHDDTHIGDVRVDKTREIISTCVFESKKIKDTISEGDRVIKK